MYELGKGIKDYSGASNEVLVKRTRLIEKINGCHVDHISLVTFNLISHETKAESRVHACEAVLIPLYFSITLAISIYALQSNKLL